VGEALDTLCTNTLHTAHFTRSLNTASSSPNTPEQRTHREVQQHHPFFLERPHYSTQALQHLRGRRCGRLHHQCG
jgi:hypothetical protein